MKKTPKLSLAIAGLVVLGAALVIAQTNQPAGVTNGAGCATFANPAMLASNALSNATATLPEKVPLPKLLDLGAGRCIPCKMMFPVLDELKKEYTGTLEVEFIDVWKNPDAGKQYGVEVIPTQIFFDANGKELFRHIGFFAKADILSKWKELGVDLKTAK
ncbi:MAG TPA: thioredoxin family protein [Candidatus Paceibacterota bacterium]|nr:thioredoxin family protein [Candidatus Paceibacterota bacterium]